MTSEVLHALASMHGAEKMVYQIVSYPELYTCSIKYMGSPTYTSGTFGWCLFLPPFQERHKSMSPMQDYTGYRRGLSLLIYMKLLQRNPLSLFYPISLTRSLGTTDDSATPDCNNLSPPGPVFRCRKRAHSITFLPASSYAYPFF